MTGTLRAAAPQPRPCKICGGDAPLYGVVDFNRSCEEARGRYLPLSGIAIYYRRCRARSFLYTDCFDDWTEADFKTSIYNEEYRAVDPDYADVRPTHSARVVTQSFAIHRSRLRILDYGDGSGKLAELLRAAGFRAAETYDPFTPAHARVPDGSFDIVTCFETLEHLPDPNAGIAEMVSRLAEPGIVLLTTCVQPFGRIARPNVSTTLAL